MLSFTQHTSWWIFVFEGSLWFWVDPLKGAPKHSCYYPWKQMNKAPVGQWCINYCCPGLIILWGSLDWNNRNGYPFSILLIIIVTRILMPHIFPNFFMCAILLWPFQYSVIWLAGDFKFSPFYSLINLWERGEMDSQSEYIILKRSQKYSIVSADTESCILVISVLISYSCDKGCQERGKWYNMELFCSNWCLWWQSI